MSIASRFLGPSQLGWGNFGLYLSFGHPNLKTPKSFMLTFGDIGITKTVKRVIHAKNHFRTKKTGQFAWITLTVTMRQTINTPDLITSGIKFALRSKLWPRIPETWSNSLTKSILVDFLLFSKNWNFCIFWKTSFPSSRIFEKTLKGRIEKYPRSIGRNDPRSESVKYSLSSRSAKYYWWLFRESTRISRAQLHPRHNWNEV